MQKITIGSKNQIVIPKEIRDNMENIKPGRTVSIYQLDPQTVIIKSTQKSWLESSYSSMKKAWKNSNPLNELKKMREDWNE